MFTGIVSAVGRITHIAPLGASAAHGSRLNIATPAGFLSDVGLGDSIAINGACMTVTTLNAERNGFTVDVSAESFARTASLNEVAPVNLEKALGTHDRLGGHLVSGHVDGVGTVISLQPVGESYEFLVRVPADLARYLAYKGSITVHGVSLTVNSVSDAADGSCTISINLIPHTVQNTVLGNLKTGSGVNLEIDLLARYVERMLTHAGSLPGVQDVGLVRPEPARLGDVLRAGLIAPSQDALHSPIPRSI